jgi:hypothetical protein
MADDPTAVNVLRMTNAIVVGISNSDETVRKEMLKQCSTPEGLKSLCEDFGVPTSPAGAVGELISNYVTNGLGPSGVARLIFDLFETALEVLGLAVFSPENLPKSTPSPLDSWPAHGTALFSFLEKLLSDEGLRIDFFKLGPDQRKALILSQGMDTDAFGELSSLNQYEPSEAKSSVQLSATVSDVMQTMYNAYQMSC